MGEWNAVEFVCCEKSVSSVLVSLLILTRLVIW